MIADDELRRLTGGRWLLPLMAHVETESGSRFAVMLARLGLSRSMLTANLALLLEVGWLARNPGHGHPLRPEYVLTKAGRPIAAFAAMVLAERKALGLEPDALSRWTLPAIVRLRDAPARFSALRAALAPVTPRALSLTLKQMEAKALIDRAIEDGYPPTAIYALSERGESLARAMRERPPIRRRY